MNQNIIKEGKNIRIRSKNNILFLDYYKKK